jgi:hypothetical protein
MMPSALAIVNRTIWDVVKAGALYFAVVFAAGIVLGAIRTRWVAPRVGTGTAELMEAPIMLGVTILGARWTVVRLVVPSVSSARLGMGSIALVFMLVAELGLALPIRGLLIKEYLAGRDAVSGSVYYVMLVVLAILPLLVARK